MNQAYHMEVFRSLAKRILHCAAIELNPEMELIFLQFRKKSADFTKFILIDHNENPQTNNPLAQAFSKTTYEHYQKLVSKKSAVEETLRNARSRSVI